jgi:hypothetical protein
MSEIDGSVGPTGLHFDMGMVSRHLRGALPFHAPSGGKSDTGKSACDRVWEPGRRYFKSLLETFFFATTECICSIQHAMGTFHSDVVTHVWQSRGLTEVRVNDPNRINRLKSLPCGVAIHRVFEQVRFSVIGDKDTTSIAAVDRETRDPMERPVFAHAFGCEHIAHRIRYVRAVNILCTIRDASGIGFFPCRTTGRSYEQQDQK